MTTVAVMQPYFVPYAGYFRLFEAADTMVVFDCVQFPRRGWVHRNRLPLSTGELDWLTLPLAKSDYHARIADVKLADDAALRLNQIARRFPALQKRDSGAEELVRRILSPETTDLTDYLVGLLKLITDRLALTKPIIRSSSLPIDPAHRGQERVLSILRHLGATRYVNAPGGRELYQHEAFNAAKVSLHFLEPYQGDFGSILQRILSTDATSLRDEIVAQTRLTR